MTTSAPVIELLLFSDQCSGDYCSSCLSIEVDGERCAQDLPDLLSG